MVFLSIQLVGIGFGLFMIYLFFMHYKKRDITRLEFAAWLLVWLVFLGASLAPHSLDFIVFTLQFKRTLDFFMFLGVFFIVFMSLYLYLKVRASSTKLDRLVRKLALERAKKK